MNKKTTAQRSSLRRRILAVRNGISARDRALLDGRILQRILALSVVQEKTCFFIYCSYQTEVATETLIDALLAQGKTVTVPLTDAVNSSMQAVVVREPKKELFPGYKNIPEPDPRIVPQRIVPPECIEVALIPGSVFDRQGNRLGYGGGYYDRFLALQAPQALRIGLAYGFQVVERLPAQLHDVPMDILVTESDLFSWSRDRTP
nr:5-formyltetrahydrofolate cyclo-ligase [uncultured Desulfobulbus sp.]